jgi:sucrose-6-phosphate hydrolase SacC (GH32 family)
VPADPDPDGVVRFQILVDRTSLELFAAGGLASASFCYLPEPYNYPLELSADREGVHIVSFTIYELEPAIRPVDG